MILFQVIESLSTGHKMHLIIVDNDGDLMDLLKVVHNKQRSNNVGPEFDRMTELLGGRTRFKVSPELGKEVTWEEFQDIIDAGMGEDLDEVRWYFYN